MFGQLRQLRCSTPPAVFQKLVVTLIPYRLDCGNAVLFGIKTYLVRRFQSVMNGCSITCNPHH
jgi:hypothetical protein